MSNVNTLLVASKTRLKYILKILWCLIDLCALDVSHFESRVHLVDPSLLSVFDISELNWRNWPKPPPHWAHRKVQSPITPTYAPCFSGVGVVGVSDDKCITHLLNNQPKIVPAQIENLPASGARALYRTLHIAFDVLDLHHMVNNLGPKCQLLRFASKQMKEGQTLPSMLCTTHLVL